MDSLHSTIQRQFHLDWIRVIATFFVFLFHCSMFFNPFPWHVKNNELDYTWVLSFSLIVGSWLMPIFFAISGISVFHALQRRSKLEFMKERLGRIGIPLLVGIFLLAPPQVYLERLSHQQFDGSFFTFLPLYFDGWYLEIGGTGNFAFIGLHLWYLFVLLIFSFLTLPLFLHKQAFNLFGKVRFLHLFLLPVPLILVVAFVKVVNLGGWDLFFYLGMFLYGFYFFRNESLKPALEKVFPIILISALVTTVIYVSWVIQLGMPSAGLWEQLLFSVVQVINCWTWILVILYLGNRYLSFSNHLLKYGSEASMPFYVLHQPVIVIVAFFLREHSWSIPLKLMVLAGLSFFLIMTIYHFVIRRVSFLRICFGLKGKKKTLHSSVAAQKTIV